MATNNNQWIELSALAIALGTFLYSFFQNKARKKEFQATDKKAETAIKISQGNIELEIRNSISAARHKLEERSKEVKSCRKNGSKDDHAFYEKLFYSALEDYINAYDTACMLYLDEKIDCDRFKLQYLVEIRNIVENKKYNERYFPAHTSKFTAILNVYAAWNNLEKQPKPFSNTAD